MNRAKSKSGELNINKLIIIILCILVLLALLMFIYKTPILDWLRNLPGYQYENDTEIEAPEVIDAAASLACVDNFEIGFLGTPEGTLGFREQYIYFKNEAGKYAKSKFYWRGSGTDGKIWFLEKDKYVGWDWFNTDIEIAEVKDGIISVKPGLLSLDSEIYQRTRFSERPIELELVNKLDGAYTAGMNRICRKSQETPFKPAWPESEGINLIPISIKLKAEGGLLYSTKYSADLSPYVDIGGSAFKFLYLVDQRSFIEIRGNTGGFDFRELGRIYPDGSVWFDKERLTGNKGGILKSKKGAELNIDNNFRIRYNQYNPPYYESNLMVNNYDIVRSVIK
jgi:hypothetical protein